ncbi:MAG: acetylglutamate kinase [Christensenellales bacterium]
MNAAKAKDSAVAQQARQQWYANAASIAAFLARANPYWNQAEWQAMLFEHLRMTENEAVQQLNGRFSDSIAQYDAIQNQALEMADVMAQGIIQQFRL